MASGNSRMEHNDDVVPALEGEFEFVREQYPFLFAGDLKSYQVRLDRAKCLGNLGNNQFLRPVART